MFDAVVFQSFADEFGKLAHKLQGHTEHQGIPIAIENRVGSVRSGTNADGSAWKTKFKLPYGYIKGTKGADNEEVDTYVGPHKDAPHAYVIHQLTDKGKHDEDTVMLGFKSKEHAHSSILKHYDDPSLLGGVSKLPIDRLKTLISSGKKLVKISTPRLDLKPGDGPGSKREGNEGVAITGQPTGGSGLVASPDQTLRLYIGQTEPANIGPISTDVRTL